MLTKDQHIRYHRDLHRSFDELLADYLMQHDSKLLTNTTLAELVEWSHKQTLNPTLPRGMEHVDELTEGSSCPFKDCTGHMGFKPVVGCSCHLTPPCNPCLENPLVCLTCGWKLGDPLL